MTRACHGPVRAAVGDRLTDEEIDEIVRRVERRAAAKGRGLDPEAVREAAGEVTRETIRDALIERRMALASARASTLFDRMMADMGEAVGDEADRLKAYDLGSERQGLGASFSVDAEAKGLTVALWGQVERQLRDEGLLGRVSGFATDPRFERRIAREMARLNGAAIEPTQDADALKVAEIMNGALERGRLMQNDQGAWIGRLEGYVDRQSHDPLKVAGGFFRELGQIGAARGNLAEAHRRAARRAFRAWRDVIRPKLDRRTFDGLTAEDLGPRPRLMDGAVDNPQDLEEVFLYHVWFDIVSGRNEVIEGAGDPGEFRPPPGLARTVSRSRVLHFTGPDAWMDYHDAYGRGSLLANVMSSLERAARNTALLRRYGPSPDALRAAKVTQLIDQARARGDARAAQKLRAEQRDGEFGQLTGAANRPESLRLAMLGSSLRTLQSLSKLGGMVLSAVSDAGFSSNAFARAGAGFLDGYRGYFGGVMRLGPADRKRAADLLDVGARSMAANIGGRFHALDGPVGWTGAAQRLFYRVNLFAAVQDGARQGLAGMLAAHLGEQARHGWDGLEAGTRETLERYGIDAGLWGLARRGVSRLDGDDVPRDYFTFEALDRLSDEELLAWAGQVEAGEDQARRVREDVAIRFRALVTGVLDDALSEARGRERAFMRGMNRPGTVWGEVRASFFQFWSFALAVQGRHIGPAARGFAGLSPVATLAHLIVATTLLGYLSLQAKQMAAGREPRPLTDEDGNLQAGELVMASMLQGGGLGIYGDFLFGEANRQGLGFGIGSLGGPLIGEFERAATILRKVMSGDPGQIEDVPADLLNLAKSNLPFANLFYTRLALDYWVWWRLKEAVSPGWLSRYQRRVEEETGADWWLEPEAAAP